jgi:hypothetical protein
MYMYILDEILCIILQNNHNINVLYYIHVYISHIHNTYAIYEHNSYIIFYICIIYIIGFLSLYNGLGVTLIGSIPKSGIRYIYIHIFFR